MILATSEFDLAGELLSAEMHDRGVTECLVLGGAIINCCWNHTHVNPSSCNNIREVLQDVI